MIYLEYNSAVGLVEIQIANTSGGSYYGHINKMGAIKYKFDQTPDQVNINRTIALYSQMTIEINQYSKRNRDLYDLLIADTTDLTGNKVLDVSVNVSPESTAFFEKTERFLFEINQKNINFNEKEQTIQLKFTPRLKKEVTISDIVDSGTNYTYKVKKTSDNTTVNINCLPAGDFIDRAMQKVFDNESLTNWNTKIQLSESRLDSSAYTNVVFDTHSNWQNNQQGFVVCGYSELIFNTADLIRETVAGEGTATIIRNTEGTNLPPPLNRIVTYKIQATNILNQFNAGDSISFDLPDEPLRTAYVLQNLSTQNEIVVSYYPFYQVTKPDNTFLNVPFSITRVKQPFLTDGLQVLKQMAGTEGAIFGSGFSTNWYIYSLYQDPTNAVTIRYQDVIDLKDKRDLLFLSDSLVGQIASLYYGASNGYEGYGQLLNNQDATVPNILQYNAVIKGNKDATKSLRIQQPTAYPFLNKVIRNGSVYEYVPIVTEDTDPAEFDRSLEKSLTENGILSYFNTLNQIGGGTKVEVQISGAFKIKPYDLFQFGSDSPERYRNKQFRVTDITYDLVQDIAKIVGYQINNLITPEFEIPIAPTSQIDDTIEDDDEPDDGGGNQDGGGVGQQFTYLLNSWNLVGSPVDYDISESANGALGWFSPYYSKGTLYEFDGTYNLSTTLEKNSSGKGYWLFLGQAIGANVEPVTLNIGQPTESNILGIPLNVGWNLITGVGAGLASVVVANTTNVTSGTLYGFNGTYNQVESMVGGQGYWCYTNVAGTIDVVTSNTFNQPTQWGQTHKEIQIENGQLQTSLFFDKDEPIWNITELIWDQADIYWDGGNGLGFDPYITESFPPKIDNTFDARINNSELNHQLRDRRIVESNTVSIDVEFSYKGKRKIKHIPVSGTPSLVTNYQYTFLNGDQIITALNVVEGTTIDIPPLTTTIKISPLTGDLRLPVRARDIADENYRLTAIYDRRGTSVTNSNVETLIEDSLFGVYDEDDDYKIEIGYRTNLAISPQIFLDDQARNVSGANSVVIAYDSIAMTTLNNGFFQVKSGTIEHSMNTVQQTIGLPTLTGNANNYNLGRGTFFTITTSQTPSCDITGIVGGVSGRYIEIMNVGTRDIIFKHDSSLSTAGNRFVEKDGLDVTLAQYEIIKLRYVFSLSRWVVV